MRITRIAANNWRNFKSIDVAVHDRLFVVGPNAAGKSNLIDLFRFLGDVASPGGGLTAALKKRGGLQKVRSLFARNHKLGRLIIEIDLRDGDDIWTYRLSVKGEGAGKNRPIVDQEVVTHNGVEVLARPDENDVKDPERLTQTHLEQIGSNQGFRAIPEYFAKVRYFHLVPQIIRDPMRAGLTNNDPYGGDFITQMNSVSSTTRQAWMRRMETALKSAVPGFESLSIEVDPAGRPHLTAGYRNWRSSPAKQTEVEFSDGTLRLIGLLWTIVSMPANGGVLLLEEPELSLNSAIIRALPTVLAMAQRDRDLQVILTTHAPEILDDEGVDPEEVLVLRVTQDGTVPLLLSQIEEVADEIAAELPRSEVVHALIAPNDLSGFLTVGRGRQR